MKTAQRYADALYSFSSDEGLSILPQIQALRNVFKDNANFLRLLSNPMLSFDEKCKMIEEVFSSNLHEYIKNFMYLLIDKRRISLLIEICDEFEEIYYAENNICKATAITAMPLNKSLQDKLILNLEKITRKRIDLHCILDPNIIGGLIVNIGNTQIDGSLKTKIEDLAMYIKNA